MKQTIFLDSSAFCKFNCNYRFYLSIIKGYTKNQNYNDTEFGSAFHTFRAAYRAGKPIQESIDLAKKYYARPMTFKPRCKHLTPEFLDFICRRYAARYKADTLLPIVYNGMSLVEQRFAVPWHSDDEVDVILCATIDELAIDKGGHICFVDAKCTGSWKPEEFLDGFNLSSQMLFYRWMIKQQGIWYPNSIFAEADRKDVCCVIDGVFHKTSSDVEFVRSQKIFYTKQQIEEIDVLVHSYIDKAIAIAKGHNITRDGLISGACHKIVQCEYFSCCDAPDLRTREEILQTTFKQKQYNPMEHGI